MHGAAAKNEHHVRVTVEEEAEEREEQALR
jgi:hypothetical protein